MPGFLDIMPLHKKVNVQGTDVDVRGISLEELMVAFIRFPELLGLLDGKNMGGLGAAQIISVAPNAVGTIIAGGIQDENGESCFDRPEYLAKAKTLPAGEQLLLLKDILEMTFPGGISPFVEWLTGAAKETERLAAAGGFITAPATTSQQPLSN